MRSRRFQGAADDLYNRKFNCYVRPRYDGSHQQFPGLDLRGLGIEDLYPSQKDAIWMIKQNGGGIATTRSVRARRLSCASQRMRCIVWDWPASR